MAGKKKILFMISQLHKGGAETSAVEIVSKLPRELYDVDFIIMNQVPVEGAISLIPTLPEWINVFDAFDARMRASRPVRHFMVRWADNTYFPETALRFVQDKEYDVAIHIGEWWAPTFLSLVVKARLKAVWIHTDIASAESFQPDAYFAYTELIDKYLFVSEHSMQNACDKFTFLRGRCALLHNMLNQERVNELSREDADIKRNRSMPLIVTVANIRPEKGHMRQLEAMKILRDRNRNFVWWNIGFESYRELTGELKERIREYGLEKRFLLLGARSNPYPYMAQADAVACLSDYESWSMVITEAKSLGIPVLATKTSGAVEQISHGVTGYLVDMTPEAIADGIEQLLFNAKVNKAVKNNLKLNPVLPDSVAEFQRLTQEKPAREAPGGARILYVIDDVNYRGGAHVAVYNHIAALLEKGRKFDVYSSVPPTWQLRNRFPQVRFWTYEISEENKLCMRRTYACVTDPTVSRDDKRLRFRYWQNRKNVMFIHERRFAFAQEFFSKYDTVCLLSEGSMFKKAAANCGAANKIQWIHTDYCSWREVSWYTRDLARDDPQTWQGMNKIVVLSPLLKRSLIQLFPQFEDRIYVSGNLMDEDGIRRRALLEEPVSKAAEGQKAEADPTKKAAAAADRNVRRRDKREKNRKSVPTAKRQERAAAPEAAPVAVQTVRQFQQQHEDVEAKKAREALIQIMGNMDDGRLQFISCFRFEPVKNSPMIIRAVARVASVRRDFHWTFIGDGEEWEVVNAAAKESCLDDVVTFVGHQSNPFPLIRKADVFVQFSKYEGLPNTIFEALILGTPVLSSNVGAIADQLTPGENGWLVAPKEDALVEALLNILEHPEVARQYKRNLKSYRYDNASVIEQLEAIFPEA